MEDVPINTLFVIQRVALEKVHARLPVEGFLGNVVRRLEDSIIQWTIRNARAVVLTATPCEIEELDARRANGVWPFKRVLCVDDAAGDLIEHIWRGYGTVEGGEEMGG